MSDNEFKIRVEQDSITEMFFQTQGLLTKYFMGFFVVQQTLQ